MSAFSTVKIFFKQIQYQKARANQTHPLKLEPSKNTKKKPNPTNSTWYYHITSQVVPTSPSPTNTPTLFLFLFITTTTTTNSVIAKTKTKTKTKTKKSISKSKGKSKSMYRDTSSCNTYNYGDALYWDARYIQEGGSFDWYQRYSALRPFVRKYIRPSSRVLMVGCGNAGNFISFSLFLFW